MDNRRSKENYYLDIAEAALERSTCLRRQFGAIIVRDDEIVATGYNGAPRGRRNCSDLGRCTRRELNIPAGERYELCRSVHAEANAIISAARRDMMGATLYLVGRDTATGGYYPETTPCAMCRRLIINAGIAPHRRRRIHDHARARLGVPRRFHRLKRTANRRRFLSETAAASFYSCAFVLFLAIAATVPVRAKSASAFGSTMRLLKRSVSSQTRSLDIIVPAKMNTRAMTV